LKIQSIEIENILSIDKASIAFGDNGLMLVEGWNHDGNTANGAGKSTIFTALSWGLYGKFPRDTAASNIIRDGARKAEVVVRFSSKGALCKVKRQRPAGVKYELNSVEVSEAEFTKTLDLTYDQFTLIQYYSQSLSPRFLDMNDTARKDHILNLMQASGFADAKTAVDQKVKKAITSISELEYKKTALQAKIEAYEENSSSDDLELQIKTMRDSVASCDLELSRLIESQRPDTGRLDELKERLVVQLSRIPSLRAEASILRSRLTDLDLRPETKPCPSCGQQLHVLDGELHVDKPKNCSTERVTLLDSIKELDAKISQRPKIEEALIRCKAKIVETIVEYERIRARREELKLFKHQKAANISAIEIQLKAIEARRSKIAECQAEIQALEAKTISFQQELQKLQTQSAVLAPTGAPSYVMDDIVSAVNSRIAEILSEVWPDASYQLLTYRENKSGAIAAKFSDDLVIAGVKRPVGAISGGERKCLSIALDLALLDVVCRYSGACVSPLILDEPFDHLDASNRERAIDLLKVTATSRQVVVVDHAAEAKALFDKIILIEKRNGVSNISMV
jgi:DNA repair exonuclease SbcCD ATPase subunit